MVGIKVLVAESSQLSPSLGYPWPRSRLHPTQLQLMSGGWQGGTLLNSEQIWRVRDTAVIDWGPHCNCLTEHHGSLCQSCFCQPSLALFLTEHTPPQTLAKKSQSVGIHSYRRDLRQWFFFLSLSTPHTWEPLTITTNYRTRIGSNSYICIFEKTFSWRLFKSS